MEQIPASQVGGRSARYKIPGQLRNSEFHHRFINSPPLDLFLSQINPVHTLTAYFIKIVLKMVVSIYVLGSKLKQRFGLQMWKFRLTYISYILPEVLAARLVLNSYYGQLVQAG
jgi:hypothetical protein